MSDKIESTTADRFEDYSIRILGLKQVDEVRLRSTVSPELISIRKKRDSTDMLNAIVGIFPSADYSNITTFIESLDYEIHCDVFLSVSSESDSEIVDVPDYVSRVIRQVPFPLVISYTCT